MVYLLFILFITFQFFFASSDSFNPSFSVGLFSHIDVEEVQLEGFSSFGHLAYNGVDNPRVKVFSFFVTNNNPLGFSLKIFSENAGVFKRVNQGDYINDPGYFYDYGITLYPSENNYSGISFVCDEDNIQQAYHPHNISFRIQDCYDQYGQTNLQSWQLTDGSLPLDGTDFVFVFDQHEYAVWHYGWDLFLNMEENFSLFDGEFVDKIYIELIDN